MAWIESYGVLTPEEECQTTLEPCDHRIGSCHRPVPGSCLASWIDLTKIDRWLQHLWRYSWERIRKGRQRHGAATPYSIIHTSTTSYVHPAYCICHHVLDVCMVWYVTCGLVWAIRHKPCISDTVLWMRGWRSFAVRKRLVHPTCISPAWSSMRLQGSVLFSDHDDSVVRSISRSFDLSWWGLAGSKRSSLSFSLTLFSSG